MDLDPLAPGQVGRGDPGLAVPADIKGPVGRADPDLDQDPADSDRVHLGPRRPGWPQPQRWAPPPNWFGPPPPGGWNGPPPPGGWNRRWDGPARDIALAQRDFGPFNYNGYNAIPVFNPVFGGWEFWFFGVWIPLY